MPELPEVETIVRGLQKQIVGKKIVGARVILPRIIRGDVEDFVTMVTGTTIQKVWRRGKMIVIDLCEERSILVHLKMTGQLVYISSDAPVIKHTHLSLDRMCSSSLVEVWSGIICGKNLLTNYG